MKHHHLFHLAASAAITLGLVAASASAEPPASAPPTDQAPMSQSQTPAQQPMDSKVSQVAKFEALDVNHDGAIDKTEAASNKVLAAQFDRLDANHDGKISPSEFANAKGVFAASSGGY
jgi:hypothetical protein